PTSINNVANVVANEADPNTGNNSQGVSANVTPGAILTVVPVSPITTAERQPLSNVIVASFTDADTSATPDDFKFTAVDWADGTTTPPSSIVATGAGKFNVLASHVYTDSGVNGGVGTFQVKTAIAGPGGSRVNATTTATVNDLPINVTGRLSAGSDSGVSNGD